MPLDHYTLIKKTPTMTPTGYLFFVLEQLLRLQSLEFLTAELKKIEIEFDSSYAVAGILI